MRFFGAPWVFCLLAALLGCAPVLKEVQPSKGEAPATDRSREAAPPHAAPAEPAAAVAPAPAGAVAPVARPTLKEAQQRLEATVRSLNAPLHGPGNPRTRETGRRLARWTSPDADPRVLQAGALEALGRPSEALDLWRALAREGAGGRDALVRLASLAVRLGRPEQAARVLEERLGRTPRDADVSGVLGWVYLTRGESAKALGPLGATWGTPAARRYALFLGSARLASGDPGGALAPARLAAEESRHPVEGWVLLGEAHRARGETAAAEEGYGRALRLKPGDYAATVNLGVLRLEAGRNADAEVLFASASQTHPALPEGWNGLGLARRVRGDYGGAAKAFGKALEGAPQFAPALKNLGILHEKYLGNPAEAVPLYDRYLAVRPGDQEVERWRKAASRLAEGGTRK